MPLPLLPAESAVSDMKRLFAVVLLLTMLLCGCGQSTEPAPTAAPDPEPASATASPAVADASQMTAVEEVVEDGMVPVGGDALLDGDYAVTVACSSPMFRIVDCVLHVSGGSMTADLTMSGKSYLYVYPGTALEAAAAEEGSWIPYAETADGSYCFTIPVDALDAGIPCAAWSRNKELWYDRTLLFRLDSLPLSAFREGVLATPESLGLSDGSYTVDVTLSGGSGKASVQSPAALRVENGSAWVQLLWSSPNYDYMKVGGELYYPLQEEGNSLFEIPLPAFDHPISVIADTVAMSEPHEITYRLVFASAGIAPLEAGEQAA